jgi:hypothetical protein
MRWRPTEQLVIIRAGAAALPDSPMPTTFRLLFALAAIGAAAYGVLFLLANVLQPEPREITVTVPPARYAK